MISQRNGKFYLYSQDGKRKLGGPYSNRSQAEARERQVNRFKHKNNTGNAVSTTLQPEPAPVQAFRAAEKHRSNSRAASNTVTETQYLGIRAQTSGSHEMRTYAGREYMVVPVVALVEGVIQGVNAESPELALASEFGRFPQGWNGRPVTMDHPFVTVNSEVIRVSANSPDILEKFSVGFMFNTKLDGNKLITEAWLDPSRLESLSDQSRELLADLKANKVIEVSTGLFTAVHVQEGRFNTAEYSGIWTSVVPDHLAFLPNGVKGACSIEDGCGAGRTNASYTTLKANCSCESSPKPTTLSEPELTATDDSSDIEFNVDKFLANTLPDGIMDTDVRQILCDAIQEAYPAAYAYVVGFTSSKVVFSMYDTIDGDRDCYQLSYELDVDAKTCELGDDLECVVLTTTITPMEEDPEVGEPRGNAAGSKEGASAEPTLAGRQKRPPLFDTENTPMTTPKTYSTAEIEARLNAVNLLLPENPSLKVHADRLTAALNKAKKGNGRIDASEIAESNTADASKRAGDPSQLTKLNQGTETTTEATPTAPAPTTLSAADWLKNAPAEIRESVQSGMKLHSQRKAAIILALNETKRCRFNEQQLNAMDLEQLENLAQLAAVPNYSGLGTVPLSDNARGGGEQDTGFAPSPPKLFEPQVLEGGRAMSADRGNTRRMFKRDRDETAA